MSDKTNSFSLEVLYRIRQSKTIRDVAGQRSSPAGPCLAYCIWCHSFGPLASIRGMNPAVSMYEIKAIPPRHPYFKLQS